MRNVQLKGDVLLSTRSFQLFLHKESRHLYRQYFLRFLLPLAFRFKGRNIRSVEDALDFVFSFKFLKVSIHPLQKRDEIATFLRLVSQTKPVTVLEIGTALGGTLFLISFVAHPEAIFLSIDLPRTDFGGGYPQWKDRLYKSFPRNGQEIHLIRGDSQDFLTRDEAKRVLAGRQVDLLFIDGDHRYEGVKRDFELYSPLVRKGGLIALHDIVDHPIETGCEVRKFWMEVKDKYQNIEIVKDLEKWGGIGVLFV